MKSVRIIKLENTLVEAEIAVVKANIHAELFMIHNKLETEILDCHNLLRLRAFEILRETNKAKVQAEIDFEKQLQAGFDLLDVLGDSIEDSISMGGGN